MLNVKAKIATVAAAGALVLGTLTTPIFAANNDFFGNDSFFKFNDNNWQQFFDDFFKRKLSADLTGAEEIPGPGDPDGTGNATVKIHLNKSELCVDLKVENIDQATAAHIHHAPKGSAGAVVISLPIPDEKGKSDGCISVDPNLLKAIQDNFQDYYINVHTNSYPNGALRGQLAR